MKNIFVKDIMIRSFKTVSPDNALSKVARLLRQTRLDGLPVTDPDGGLIGIMTKANFYDAIADGLPPDTPIKNLYTKKLNAGVYFKYINKNNNVIYYKISVH